jgi:hypothetical protein
MTTTTHAFEVEKASAERLKFFSDAVIAIAMTLLALELPVPSGETVGEVWRSFGGNWEEYLAFLITFWVIGQQWMNHDLAGPEAPAGFYRDIQVRLLGLALIFAVAVPFAYLIGHWAYAIWVAGPAVIGGLRRRVGRQRR